MVCRHKFFYAEYFYLFAVFSLLYYHFITAFILPHFSKNAQLLLGLFRQTEALAIASAFFNCFATVENPRFYRGKKKA